MNKTKQYEVFCRGCDEKEPKLIGTIGVDSRNNVSYLEQNGLISWRTRSDGQFGYECMNCRSWSMCAREEIDEVLRKSGVNTETRIMMLAHKKRPKVLIVNGKTVECDGFITKEVS